MYLYAQKFCIKYILSKKIVNWFYKMLFYRIKHFFFKWVLVRHCTGSLHSIYKCILKNLKTPPKILVYS